MDVATEALQAGAPEGLVIIADEQTAGRGRRGRDWSSPPGAGLYVSIVLRPSLDDDGARVLSVLTLAAGVAVREAIARAAGVAPDVKWPNDLVIGRRKLAGILAEGSAIGTPAQAVILGVGINVMRASHPPEIRDRATTLEEELGRAVDRAPLLEELLVAVPAHYDHIRRGDAAGVLQAWRQAAPAAHGARVEWEAGTITRRGITAGIDDAGALLIQTADGVERVIAGEIKWL